jgi:hypothetical protein
MIVGVLLQKTVEKQMRSLGYYRRRPGRTCVNSCMTSLAKAWCSGSRVANVCIVVSVQAFYLTRVLDV